MSTSLKPQVDYVFLFCSFLPIASMSKNSSPSPPWEMPSVSYSWFPQWHQEQGNGLLALSSSKHWYWSWSLKQSYPKEHFEETDYLSLFGPIWAPLAPCRDGTLAVWWRWLLTLRNFNLIPMTLGKFLDTMCLGASCRAALLQNNIGWILSKLKVCWGHLLAHHLYLCSIPHGSPPMSAHEFHSDPPICVWPLTPTDLPWNVSTLFPVFCVSLSYLCH